jgi:hypothetical protein
MAVFPSSRPNITLRVLPKIPATLIAIGGIVINKVQGVWTIKPDWNSLQLLTPSLLLDPGTKEIWTHDPITDVYNRLTLAGLGQAIWWGTSVTPLTIGAGTKIFTTQSNKAWLPGMYVQAISQGTPSDTMIGQVTAYSGVTLTVNMLQTSGTVGASHFDWLIIPSTLPGSVSVAGQALTAANDTNVTATLGGTPSAALVNASSITLGWSGTLAGARGGTNNGFMQFAGPATVLKTFTLPNQSANVAALDVADQQVSGGANVTTLVLAPGNVTIDCGQRPLQSIVNNAAFTVTAPANDGSCLLKVTNGVGAGAITFTGFSVNPANVGDPIGTVNGAVFTISIWRIGGVAGYRIAAHQ